MPNTTRKKLPSKSQRPLVKHNSTIRSIGTRLIKASSRTYDEVNKRIQNFTNPKRDYEKEANDAAKEYRLKKKIMIDLEKGLDEEFNGHQKSYNDIKSKLNETNIHTIRFLFLTYYELMGRTVGQDDNTYVPTSDPEYVYFLYDLFNAKHGPKDEPNGDYTYTLYQLCVLLDQTQYLPYIPLMKDREKQLEQDQIWKKVCEELDWQYTPTV